MDMTFDILTRATELRSARTAFVLATVTVSQAPTSARAGSRAVITRDGSLFGWVGGACSQPSVVAHALDALDAGETRVIRLSTDGRGGAREGIIELPMSCHSGGTLEIFLEPFVPPPLLLIVGDSPVASAVADLGRQADFGVVEVADASGIATACGRERPQYVLVATMGIDDESALEHVLAQEPTYVGMVGSRRRFQAVADYLRAREVATAAIDAIHAPAGLDIHATTPVEIALSILAEMVSVRRASAGVPHVVAQPEEAAGEVIDPVCGMRVDLRTAKHTLVLNGQTYGFCCPSCKRQFSEARAAG
jgi:xanthine dehydrogenase accessory factor